MGCRVVCGFRQFQGFIILIAEAAVAASGSEGVVRESVSIAAGSIVPEKTIWMTLGPRLGEAMVTAFTTGPVTPVPPPPPPPPPPRSLSRSLWLLSRSGAKCNRTSRWLHVELDSTSEPGGSWIWKEDKGSVIPPGTCAVPSTLPEPSSNSTEVAYPAMPNTMGWGSDVTPPAGISVPSLFLNPGGPRIVSIDGRVVYHIAQHRVTPETESADGFLRDRNDFAACVSSATVITPGPTREPTSTLVPGGRGPPGLENRVTGASDATPETRKLGVLGEPPTIWLSVAPVGDAVMGEASATK